jgi:hypothetical protein
MRLISSIIEYNQPVSLVVCADSRTCVVWYIALDSSCQAVDTTFYYTITFVFSLSSRDGTMSHRMSSALRRRCIGTEAPPPMVRLLFRQACRKQSTLLCVLDLEIGTIHEQSRLRF